MSNRSHESGVPALPLVRAEVLTGCLEAAAEINADLPALLAAHGIDSALLSSPSGFIEKTRLVGFLAEVAERYSCPYFGWLVGKNQPPLKFGPSAQLLKLAPTLGAALANVIRFSELYTQAVSYELTVNADEASFRRTNTWQYAVIPLQLDLVGMVQLFKMFRGLCGESWRPRAIRLENSALSVAKEMTDFFGCPVLFNQDSAAVVFSASDLDTPLPGANQELLEIVEAYFTEQLPESSLAEDIVTQTEAYIRGQLGTGLCNVENCARQLRIHSRTLQRALADKGCTFKQMMYDTRMELARHHLRKSDVGLAELTDLLGYENQSALSRAFKLEHGVPPTQWRRDLRAG